jgi:hypothetical protein
VYLGRCVCAIIKIILSVKILAMGQYPDREPMVTDACVPLSGLPELIERSRNLLDESGLPSPIIAHAGIFMVVLFEHAAYFAFRGWKYSCCCNDPR